MSAIDELAVLLPCDCTPADGRHYRGNTCPAFYRERFVAVITAQEQRLGELESQHAAWLIERAELTALATGLEAERDAYRLALAKATGSTTLPPYAAPDCEPPRETSE